MSFSKLALASLAGLLATSPLLAQKVPPRPALPITKQPAAKAVAKPTAVAPAPRPDDTRQFFRLTPERPVSGQPVVLSYSPAGSPVAGKAGVRAVVYYFDIANLRWEASDLPLQPGTMSGELTASFTPPATTGFAAFKFVAADGTTDNHHDQGYFYMLADPTRPGMVAAGANMGYGVLRKPDFGLSIPAYFKDFTISDEALFLWLKQELHFHPENAPALMPQFLAAAQPVLGTSFAHFALAALRQASRQSNLRETDLLGIEQGYRNVAELRAQADSVAQVLNQRFPKGYLARQAQCREIGNVRDFAQKLARWEAFLQAYPPEATYEFPARYAIDYNKIYQDIMLLNIAQKNYPALTAYVPKLSYNGLMAIYYKAVQVSIRPNILTPAQALPYATLLMQRIDQLGAQRPVEFAYLSPIEWQHHHATTSNRNRIHYAGLLTELGQYAQARPYAEAAQKVANYSVADLNDVQAAILHQGGAADQAQLRQVLEASVNHNQASPRMLDWLRESYTAAHPGGAGYDQYLASLQNEIAKREARAKLAGEIVKKPIADFALRDLDGKLVRLSALKGKTVVLDFWATWCVPCKASFPGMKLAQDRFKDDPNVVFYFIDTDETEPDYKAQVRDYITAKGFPFKVLFDEKAPGGKKMDATYSTYGKAYHISGIPQKLIIDPAGNLRFLTDGYSGSPSALADEIEAMVDLARTTK